MATDLSRLLTARWPDPEPAHVPLLRQAGIEAVVVPGVSPPSDSAFARAASAAGLAVLPESALEGGVTRGLWPGIRRPGRRVDWDNDLVATASAEPWIDSNLYLAPLERALTGVARPLIAYQAAPAADQSVPFETLEVAMLEAGLNGGNYVLSIEPRYRAALLAGDARARAAWAALGVTAAWLRENESLTGQPAPPTITALVEPSAPTAELSNLLYRRNGSPRLHLATAPFPADARKIAVLSAASLRAVPPAAWRLAETGATLVIDNPALVKPVWKRVKREPDRDFFALGSGRVVVYNKRVMDPSEFALDLIDLAGHQRRAARIWNATSAVTWSTLPPAAGTALLHILNYGSERKEEVQARIHGHYSRATLLRPESAPKPLEINGRGPATEVFLPGLLRAAVVRFEGGV